jgi:hypothetical protein
MDARIEGVVEVHCPIRCEDEYAFVVLQNAEESCDIYYQSDEPKGFSR